MRPTSPLVELVGVHKSFGAQKVLRGVDLAFAQGRTTVVLGPSGSGKSVILKHIAGLMKPDAGEVRFRGQNIERLNDAQLAPVRRQLGFLFQQSAMFDSMSIQENLEFPLIEHTTLSASERAQRVAQALETVDLSGVQAKFPAQLSGGQQKRAALARAMITGPDLMLYDEPTTGLDPIRSDGISEMILRLRRQTGVTGIVVTHDLACMRKVADRVVMLFGGKIIFDGTVDQIYASDDEHVQHFIAGVAEPDVAEEPAGEHDAGKRRKRPLGRA